MKIVDPSSRCKTCPWYYDSKSIMEGKGKCKKHWIESNPISFFGQTGWQIVEEDEFCSEHPGFRIVESDDNPEARQAIDDVFKESP